MLAGRVALVSFCCSECHARYPLGHGCGMELVRQGSVAGGTYQAGSRAGHLRKIGRRSECTVMLAQVEFFARCKCQARAILSMAAPRRYACQACQGLLFKSIPCGLVNEISGVDITRVPQPVGAICPAICGPGRLWL